MSLIQSQFDCDVVWTNISKGLSDKIQKRQNRAARIIMVTAMYVPLKSWDN